MFTLALYLTIYTFCVVLPMPSFYLEVIHLYIKRNKVEDHQIENLYYFVEKRGGVLFKLLDSNNPINKQKIFTFLRGSFLLSFPPMFLIWFFFIFAFVVNLTGLPEATSIAEALLKLGGLCFCIYLIFIKPIFL